MDAAEFGARVAGLRETRARLPELVRNRHATRRRRAFTGHDGRLLLIEADAPARAILDGPSGAGVLADRGALLLRLAQALETAGVDGIIATADVVDDLLLLERLEDRLVLGALNPGGVAGSAFEDVAPFSGYDPATVGPGHLDGGRLRLRIDAGDAGSATVLERAGQAITALAVDGVVALVEPRWGPVGADRSAEALVRAVSVASALGSRSPYTWLCVPVVPDLERVVGATTLPVLLTVEESDAAVGDLDAEAAGWQSALALPGVRGLVVPASRLYPRTGDPLAVVAAAASAVSSTGGRAGS